MQDRCKSINFKFKSKAQTLASLKTKLNSATILDQFCFNEAEWRRNEYFILNKIQNEFSDAKIIIRSSALNEDTSNYSNAGIFHSESGIDAKDKKAIRQGIKNVINSFYSVKTQNGLNEIFIQPYISDSKMSGVIFTREIEYGAPYYIINYSNCKGKTDIVTNGKGDQLNTAVICKYANCITLDQNITQLINLAKSLEKLTECDSLDIEFAINEQNEIFLFQVRPLVTPAKGKRVDDNIIVSKLNSAKKYLSYLFQPHPKLYGKTTILANMPDWNPVEIIGSTPRPLTLSLYQYLITDVVWSKSRSAIGYKVIPPNPLVLSLIGQPYIDCRISFNSFLPSTLSSDISEKLINHYLDRLKANPELHDKVEFDIAITCFTFDINYHCKRLTEAGFKQREISIFKESLLKLTNRVFNDKSISTARQLNDIKRLSERRENWVTANKNNTDVLRSIGYLLNDCIQYGTFAFSTLARFAFIAISFLKSLKHTGVISIDDYNIFHMDVPSIASTIANDIDELVIGNQSISVFLEKYGHLRPGTYDILSPRYDENPDRYISNLCIKSNSFKSSSKIRENSKQILFQKINDISSLIANSGLECTAEQLIDFIGQNIQAREYAKFEFTKNLSETLRLLSIYADTLGMNKDDMSFVPIKTFLTQTTNNSINAIKQNLQRVVSQNRDRYNITRSVQLPSLITSYNDIDNFHYNKARPNFITSRTICAETVSIMNDDNSKELKGNIVMMVNADPGYDWIFSRNIAGLITKYGGVASHMAIRSAEFGIPSAIGCGEIIFNQLLSAKRIELDCLNRRIHIVE